MSESLKRFENYILFQPPLAQGGMAEIYRAFPLIPSERAQQVVVVKCILDNISGAQNFIAMFRSEAETTRLLTDDSGVAPDERRNSIVKVYSHGEENGRQFMVMEYVNGRNLKQLSAKYEARDPMPWQMAAYVTAKAAGALHFAHEFRDPVSGASLDLVHRDVKPMNILVGYDGKVKLIDFGIAKATTSGDKTDTGIIKGTVRYLSPEQITGEKLDGRSDQFSLGIILWELLTGRKLFDGKSDLDILKKIEACNNEVKNPLQFRPELPQPLCNIVLKALARERKHRFENLGQMRAALLDCLAEDAQRDTVSDVEMPHVFDESDLSHAMNDRFRIELREDNRKLQKLIEDAREMAKSVPTVTAVKKAGRREERILEFKPEDAPAAGIGVALGPKPGIQTLRPASAPDERSSRSRPSTVPVAAPPAAAASPQPAPRPANVSSGATAYQPRSASARAFPASTTRQVPTPTSTATLGRRIRIPRWAIAAGVAAALLGALSTRMIPLLEDLTGGADRAPADTDSASGGASIQRRDFIDFTRGNEPWIEVILLVTPEGEDTRVTGQGPDNSPPIDFGRVRKLRVGRDAPFTIWASHPLWNGGAQHQASLSFKNSITWPISLPSDPNQPMGLLEVESVNQTSLGVAVAQNGRRIHSGVAGLSPFAIELPFGIYQIRVGMGGTLPSAGGATQPEDAFAPQPCEVRINGSRRLKVALGPGAEPFCPPGQ